MTIEAYGGMDLGSRFKEFGLPLSLSFYKGGSSSGGGLLLRQVWYIFPNLFIPPLPPPPAPTQGPPSL